MLERLSFRKRLGPQRASPGPPRRSADGRVRRDPTQPRKRFEVAFGLASMKSAHR